MTQIKKISRMECYGNATDSSLRSTSFHFIRNDISWLIKGSGSSGSVAATAATPPSLTAPVVPNGAKRSEESVALCEHAQKRYTSAAPVKTRHATSLHPVNTLPLHRHCGFDPQSPEHNPKHTIATSRHHENTLFSVLLCVLCVSVLNISSIFAQSPYIHKVFDYRPAPGQFVNQLPEYETGDTQEDMNRKAEESIGGDNKGLISLGAYGGYVVFGFDHPVANVLGEYDFKIWGNAVISTPPGAPDGGSCEPGIVMVAYDDNGNGLPDDLWYELAGSEYSKPETVKNYQITYLKSQSGYPQWIADETLSFEGTKLADNAVDISGNGSNYVLYAYPWGYADNYPNNDDRSNFNIEWAVDGDGNPVHLPAIHFVKVYTGVDQDCGWLGETSTEIMGAEDLHPSATGIGQNETDKPVLLLNNPVKEQLLIASDKQQNADVYDCLGRKQMSFELKSGTNHIPCSQLAQGVYVLVAGNKTVKFIKS